MATMTFVIEGEVNVSFTLVEQPDGSIGFTIDVLDDTGSIGDLNAIFFDLLNDSLTDTLTISGDDVSGIALKEDGVTKVDSYTNMNGEVVKDLGKFDGGVQFGTSGIGEDDIRSTTFTISSSERALTLDDFALQDFGVRLTSVGAEDGSRGDSLKLGGTAPEAPDDAPVNTANDDFMEVLELEGFDGFDFLLDGSDNLLSNDTTDDGAYLGAATAANGDTGALGSIVEGSNGGYLIVNADGSFDFSTTSLDGVNDFAALETFEVAETMFTYTIEGGSTANVNVRVLGLSDGGPPPPPPPPPPGGGGGDVLPGTDTGDMII